VKLHVTIAGRDVPVEIEGGGASHDPTPGGGTARALVDGKDLLVSAAGGGAEVSVEGSTGRAAFIVLPGKAGQEGVVRLQLGGRVIEARVVTERDRLRALARPAPRRGGVITARSTLPGIIRRILVRTGDPVEEGTPVLTLEAMKMENEVRAEAHGRIRAILVEEGQVVNAGEALAEIEVGKGTAPTGH
jgi:biotin carboxyl carrier protein